MIVAVVYMIIAGIIAVTDQLRCVDAAREAARLVARGEPADAHYAAHRIAPTGATVHISVTGDHIEVQIGAHTLLPTLTVSGSAFAVAEPQGAES
jgi:Flp pilus assembly protein TadG